MAGEASQEVRGMPRRRQFAWVRALRAFSFPLSVLPVFVATAVALPPAEWRWDVLIASVVGVVLLHAAGNLLNDYFDFKAGVDRKVEGDEGRPGRLLVCGEMAPAEVLAEAGVCLLVAIPAGAYLAWKSGPAVLWFGAAAALALYAYTGPPLRLKYNALGEVAIFIVFGPLLMAGAAFAQTGRWEWPAFLLSVPVGLVTTTVLLGNNMRDIDEDGKAGVKTLARTIGPRAAGVGYVIGVLAPPLGVACLVLCGLLGTGALACLISLLPAALLLRKALAAHRLPDIDARTAQYAAVFMATLGLGMVLL